MEKKKYEELNLEVVRFDAEDVVATSGDVPGPIYICQVVGCSGYEPYVC